MLKLLLTVLQLSALTVTTVVTATYTNPVIAIDHPDPGLVRFLIFWLLFEYI